MAIYVAKPVHSSESQRFARSRSLCSFRKAALKWNERSAASVAAWLLPGNWAPSTFLRCLPWDNLKAEYSPEATTDLKLAYRENQTNPMMYRWQPVRADLTGFLNLRSAGLPSAG